MKPPTIPALIMATTMPAMKLGVLLLIMVLGARAQRTYMRTCDCEYVVDGKCAYTILLPLNQNALPPTDGTSSCPSSSGSSNPSLPSGDEFQSLTDNVTLLRSYSLEQSHLLAKLQSSLLAVQQTITTVVLQQVNETNSLKSLHTKVNFIENQINRLDNSQRLDSLVKSNESMSIKMRELEAALRASTDRANALESDIANLERRVNLLPTNSNSCAKFSPMVSDRNGTILEGVKLNVSTQFNDDHGPEKVSIYSSRIPAAWCPGEPNEEEWIQFDLGFVRPIYGVVTRGRADYAQWVTSYSMQYAEAAGDDWIDYADVLGDVMIFEGNTDQNTAKTNMLWQPFNAQLVRLIPIASFEGRNKCMRADLVSCLDNS